MWKILPRPVHATRAELLPPPLPLLVLLLPPPLPDDLIKSMSVGKCFGNFRSSFVKTPVAPGRREVRKDVREGLQIGAWQ